MMAYSEMINRLRNRFDATASLFAAHRAATVLSLATAISLAGAVYFYAQWNSLRDNPQAAFQDETATLVAAVGKLMLLPEGETPTIATVSDLERLKGQPFFANAKNGDKVLIYSNSKKAILYDPVNKKIIEVAPLNTGAQTP